MRMSQATRKRMSKAAKARWADPTIRNQLLKVRAAPEYRQKKSLAAKAQWADAEGRRKMIEARAKPEYRQGIREKLLRRGKRVITPSEHGRMPIL